MDLLFIVGSMRNNSFNKQLSEEAKKLIGNRANVSYLDYKDIPFMNQDLEANLPEYIKDIKDKVKQADGIWIFTPEYNGMIPGVLKNLLDWLSRSFIPGNFASGTAVRGKPVTISGVGGGNATKGSRGQLDILLKRIGMKLMDNPETGLTVPPAQMKADKWEMTDEDIDQLKNQVNDFLKFVKENET